MLAYLARYTHRVAIGNSRLVAADGASVTFKVQDYRVEGPDRYKTMTVARHEFIRRFLLHVLPKGFHRIRHYGLLAGSRTKADTLARARKLIPAAAPATSAPQPQESDAGPSSAAADKTDHSCPHCRCRIVIIETFDAGQTPRHRPSVPALLIRVDTS